MAARSCVRRPNSFEAAVGQVWVSGTRTHLAQDGTKQDEGKAHSQSSCQLCSLSRLCVDRNLVSSSCFQGSGLFRCCTGTAGFSKSLWSLWQIRWRCSWYSALHRVLESCSSAPVVKRASFPGSCCYCAVSMGQMPLESGHRSCVAACGRLYMHEDRSHITVNELAINHFGAPKMFGEGYCCKVAVLQPWAPSASRCHAASCLQAAGSEARAQQIQHLVGQQCSLCSLVLSPNAELRWCLDRSLVSSPCFVSR